MLCADSLLFDASQYAFFNKGGMEEVELGGLEDDDYSLGLEEESKFPSLGDKEVSQFLLYGCLKCRYLVKKSPENNIPLWFHCGLSHAFVQIA